jgi:hypothetical protein
MMSRAQIPVAHQACCRAVLTSTAGTSFQICSLPSQPHCSFNDLVEEEHDQLGWGQASNREAYGLCKTTHNPYVVLAGALRSCELALQVKSEMLKDDLRNVLLRHSPPATLKHA